MSIPVDKTEREIPCYSEKEKFKVFGASIGQRKLLVQTGTGQISNAYFSGLIRRKNVAFLSHMIIQYYMLWDAVLIMLIYCICKWLPEAHVKLRWAHCIIVEM